eukprot:gene8900-5581_t
MTSSIGLESTRLRVLYLMARFIRLLAGLWQLRCREVLTFGADSWQGRHRDRLWQAAELGGCPPGANDADARVDTVGTDVTDRVRSQCGYGYEVMDEAGGAPDSEEDWHSEVPDWE